MNCPEGCAFETHEQVIATLRQTVTQLGKVDAARHTEMERLRAEVERLKEKAEALLARVQEQDRWLDLRDDALKACMGALNGVRIDAARSLREFQLARYEFPASEMSTEDWNSALSSAQARLDALDAALALATPLLKEET